MSNNIYDAIFVTFHINVLKRTFVILIKTLNLSYSLNKSPCTKGCLIHVVLLFFSWVLTSYVFLVTSLLQPEWVSGLYVVPRQHFWAVVTGREHKWNARHSQNGAGKRDYYMRSLYLSPHRTSLDFSTKPNLPTHTPWPHCKHIKPVKKPILRS